MFERSFFEFYSWNGEVLAGLPEPGCVVVDEVRLGAVGEGGALGVL